MKALIIALALALSPVGKMVCQLTCFRDAPTQEASVPSCHERDDMQDGPAVKATGTCQHSDGQLLSIKAVAQFQVSGPFVERFSLAVSIARPLHTIEVTPARSISPPPLLLPLRI